MTVRSAGVVAGWMLAVAAAAPAAAQDAPAARESPIEIPIQVPPPTPTGVFVGYKPMILSVRSDTGHYSQFGSDRAQFLRAIARVTFQPIPDKPVLLRFELEGGQFQTHSDSAQLGSNGWDATTRLQIAAAARISSSFLVLAGAGPIARYQRGRAVAGAPNIGMLGAASSFEANLRLFPAITAVALVEGAVAPIAFMTQRDLGSLSDASEVRLRLTAVTDVTRNVSVEIGYDFTRWHASFVNSTILSGNTSGALHVETREHSLILGIRWRP